MNSRNAGKVERLEPWPEPPKEKEMENSWEVEIEKLTNGYKVTYKNGSRNIGKVYTEKDVKDPTNKDHFLDIFSDLIEHFAEVTSKYNKRRIKLCYIKGNSYAGKEKPEDGVDYEVIK